MENIFPLVKDLLAGIYNNASDIHDKNKLRTVPMLTLFLEQVDFAEGAIVAGWGGPSVAGGVRLAHDLRATRGVRQFMVVVLRMAGVVAALPI